MSKFCGKCGARLDEATGLCPNCDAEALRNMINQAQRQNARLSKKEAREQRREAQKAERAAEKAEQKAAKKAAKKVRKQQKKAAKKAAKKEKWAAKPWWKKLLSVVLRCVAWLLILAIVAAPVAFVLVRWQIIDIPVVSRILSRTGLEAPVDVELDPTRDNYIPNDASVKFDADANIYYADNELVIIFSTSATEEQIMQAIDSVGGKIAGTIPSLNMYQITIAGSHTLNELLSISQELMERYEYISYASFDSAVVNSGSAYSATPNDPWDKDVNQQDWTDLDVDGSNWWIEAIEAQEAWAYADDFPVINVGISDSSFDIGHEDLKNKSSFPNDILRSRNVVTPWWNDGDSKTWSVSGQTNYHGTHVAGIIGAEHNNKKGISGVAPNCHMFFAPYYRNEQAGTYLWWDTSTYANLAYLVESGAKVINYSQGKTNFLTVSNSQFTTVFLEREGNMAAISMARLLDRGYDFIVVQSAGNGTGDNGTAVDALQNGWFASVTSSSITGLSNVSIDDVRDRIIIVGAAEQNGNGYRCTSFSNYGTQVDIFAPGRNIYSTVPGEVLYGFELWGGYAEASGTSMAAPIVTGVCALTWSANTQLTAAQVKEIVCSNTKDVVVTHPNTPDTSTYNLVNAKLSVEAAKNYSSTASGSSTSGMENDGDFENNRVTSDERDIVLVLDTSGSMSGTPMAETKKASINFIDTILDEDASIGIVTYDYSAYMLSDFSVDKNALTTAISGIYDGGGTDIESGLAQAHAMLGTSNAKKKIIVLMSDGEPNEGKEGQALIDYADEIKDDGVIIYTLGFFESLGSYKSSAQVLMEGIASDGCHYEVASADDLVFFFEDVADQINGQKYIYIRIACPVDVSVSYGGETLDSSKDDLSQRTEFGTLTYEENENASADSDDRIKILRLKEGVEYDVQIVGTGRGVMDYTIGFMDEDGQYSDLREFENIKITRSTVIDTVAEVSDETVLKIDEDGDGRYDIKYRAKENGFGEEVGSDLMVFVYIGAASAAILLMVSLIFKLLRRKHRQE